MDVVGASARHLGHTVPEGSPPQNQQERERRNPLRSLLPSPKDQLEQGFEIASPKTDAFHAPKMGEGKERLKDRISS